jgi:hypothetical protein
MGLVVGSCTSHLEFWVRFQTRGTRGNRAPPCVKEPGSSRVPTPPGWAPDPLLVGSDPDGLVVAPDSPWSFGFDSQTRGTRENRAPPCVKVPGSSRVPGELLPLWRGAGGDGLLAGTRRRPAAEDSVPASLQILSHTHILTVQPLAPYSPTTPRQAHSPTAFSGLIARPSPSPAHAPCSHPQVGPPDSAASPVIVLYSRNLCASLRVLELPPSPAGFQIWVSTSSSPLHTAHAHIH